MPVNNCVKAEKLRGRLRRRAETKRKQSLANIRPNARNNRRYIDIMPRDLSTFRGFSMVARTRALSGQTPASNGIIIDTCHLEKKIEIKYENRGNFPCLKEHIL